MTLLHNNSFTGVQTNRVRVAAPVRASDLAEIAKDQALIYELVTGKNADGTSGAPVIAGHDHTELGNLLPWPLASWCGCPSTPNLKAWAAAAADNWQGAAAINNTSTDTDIDRFTLFHWPLFVLAGWGGHPFLVVFDYVGDDDAPPCYVTLEDNAGSPYALSGADVNYSTFTPVADVAMAFAPFSTRYGDMLAHTPEPTKRALYVARITPDTNGLFAVRVEAEARPLSTHVFRALTIVPYLSGVKINGPALHAKAPARAGAPNVNVGDPTATTANDWTPIDSLIAAADFPFGPLAMLNNINGSYLEERCLGLPATGNATTTVGGHRHDGSTAKPYDAVQVDVPLASYPMGTTATSGITDRLKAPKIDDPGAGTYYLARTMYLRVPANATAGSNIYCALLVENDEGGKGAKTIARVQLNLGNQVTYTSGAADATHYMLTSNTPLAAVGPAVPSGEYVAVTVEFGSDNSGTAPFLLGACLWCGT